MTLKQTGLRTDISVWSFLCNTYGDVDDDVHDDVDYDDDVNGEVDADNDVNGVDDDVEPDGA